MGAVVVTPTGPARPPSSAADGDHALRPVCARSLRSPSSRGLARACTGAAVVIALVGAAALGAPTAAAQAGAPGAGGPQADTPEAVAPARVERLDRPGRRSYFAFVNRRTIARARPRATAPAVARLGLRTEDRTAELVLALERRRDADGHAWLRVRLPSRPNNSTGWVPAAALGTLQPLRTWLRIDTRRLRATLVKGGRVVFRAPVGVGQRQWPTPRGDFYIRHKLEGYGSAGSFYGPVAFGTNARSDRLTDWPGGAIVGIHGTSLPNLLPGRVSHGCVRMRNADILRLERLMPIGTPLTIS